MFVNSGKLEGVEAEPKLLRAKLKILIEGGRIILLAEYKRIVQNYVFRYVQGILRTFFEPNGFV